MQFMTLEIMFLFSSMHRLYSSGIDISLSITDETMHTSLYLSGPKHGTYLLICALACLNAGP